MEETFPESLTRNRNPPSFPSKFDAREFPSPARASINLRHDFSPRFQHELSINKRLIKEEREKGREGQVEIDNYRFTVERNKLINSLRKIVDAQLACILIFLDYANFYTLFKRYSPLQPLNH